jgi:hypothetical protein
MSTTEAMDLDNDKESLTSSVSSTELRKMLAEAGIGDHVDLGSQSLTSLGEAELARAIRFQQLRQHGLEVESHVEDT